jgi:hypothetical protein
MSNHLGKGNLFGLTDVTAVSIANLCQLTEIQSLEMSEEAEEQLVKDGAGKTSAVNKYDHKRKLTIDFIPTSGTSTGTLTVTTTIPTVGATLAITGALLQHLNDTWLVDAVNWTRSNTAAMQCRINLTSYIEGALP